MMRTPMLVVLIVAGVALGCRPRHVAAQGPADDLVNLFFDCSLSACDLDFLRRQVPFVSWVRVREAADVHVLVTSQETGGGGRLYTLDFIGLGDAQGADHRLTHVTAGDATSDEERNGLAERLKVGLVRYVLDSSAVDGLRVEFRADDDGSDEGGAGQRDDPWDFWNFRLNMDAYVNGEATYKSAYTFGQVEADRTTDAWKLNVALQFNQEVQTFEYEDDDEASGLRRVRETRRDWGVSTAAVRSVGAHWAVGLRTDVGRSTYYNQDYRIGVKPGIEYDVFPYSQSSRRSLTLQYLVGPLHWNYHDPTIFDETSETRVQQSLTARIALIQPWGRWTTSVTTAQYLHDTGKYNVQVRGDFNIRIFRGFSIRMGGSYTWIRDQLYLSAQSATDEEVLLRQRQLATSFRYFTNFGIEYRFGSIFNNVVNPRFGSGGQVFITG